MNRITRMKIKNFKSLQDVDVELGDLNVLVGKNGSGKSNFVDALSFVADALRHSFDTATIKRHDWFIDPYKTTSIEVYMIVDDVAAEYHLEFNPIPPPYQIQHELYKAGNQIIFERVADKWEVPPAGIDIKPSQNSLSILLLATLEQAQPAYDYLSSMAFYNIQPARMKSLLHTTRVPLQLMTDGTNFAVTLKNILERGKHIAMPFKDVLLHAVPHIRDINVKQAADLLEVLVDTPERNDLNIAQESDGTLRILGILLALYQVPWPALIAIEEPEQTVHAGALAVLCDAIKEAATRSQLIITTHSPDMIANFDINDLRIVERTGEGTRIGFLKESQRKAVEQELFGPDSLLRIDGELHRQQSS